MPLLSIIVPVYNKEKYLPHCIDSILDQSFTDFELILVNDGSTDGSEQICRGYNDKRIIVISQDNGGVSSARNRGLAIASGAYIGFVDGDDTIERGMYAVLINNILSFNADISLCRMRVVSNEKIVNPGNNLSKKNLNRDEALSAYLRGDLDMSANNKIYKADIAKNIQFEGSINEDILYTFKAFLASDLTFVSDEVGYNYLVRDNSASMSSFGSKYMQIVSVASKIRQLVIKNKVDSLIDTYRYDVVSNISVLNLILLAGKDRYSLEYQEVIENLRNYGDFINHSKVLSLRYRYAYKLFCLSPWAYTQAIYYYGILTNSDLIKRT